MPDGPMRILLTNDDGVHAEGLENLALVAREFGRIEIVAPDREQSGASHALTMNRPVRLRRLDPSRFAVDGTPTDCVLLAVRGLKGAFEQRPDLVLSGINHGSNLGDDVTYSGTVAAAMEASLFGIPAVAFSLQAGSHPHWETARSVARTVLGRLLSAPDQLRGLLLNVNIPNCDPAAIRGYRVARLGRRVYPGEIRERLDPHGRPYYWIGDTDPVWSEDPDTDYAAVRSGHVALTPLHLDLTDYAGFEAMRALRLDRNEEG